MHAALQNKDHAVGFPCHSLKTLGASVVPSRQALIILLLVFSYPARAQEHSLPLPSGWKTPKPITASGCDRKRSDLLSAIADFDGDGNADTAKILAKQEGKGLGVWVWLSTQKVPTLVAMTEHEDGKHDMGIAVVEPGAYDTACGKGYWECKEEEPAKIILTNSAINFFTCESANRFLFWDAKEKKFKTIWMSD